MSVSYDIPKYIDLTWAPEEHRYLSENALIIFKVLLWILMALMVLWFVMIIKVIIRMFTQGAAGDVRSDEEDDDDTSVYVLHFISMLNVY